jgi:hypothetical protein
MKATHNKDKEVEWKFPCLGWSHIGTVVLFIEPKKGTVVKSTEITPYTIGKYFETWNMYTFKPLPSTESVTLQND